MAHKDERQARFLPPRHDAPRLDAASLPAAGASARHDLNTRDERRLKEGKASMHYTFVDGAVFERPGGRRPAPDGSNETMVHECLNIDPGINVDPGTLAERTLTYPLALALTLTTQTLTLTPNQVAASRSAPKADERRRRAPISRRSTSAVLPHPYPYPYPYPYPCP